MADNVTTTDGLDITANHGTEGALVRLHGRLNIDSSPALRDRLHAMLQGDHPEALTVDLTETTYVDCSGIATLIEALKIARNHQTTLRLQGLHDRLLHLFTVTGVLSLFQANPGTGAPVSKVL
jgi:anti-sigma B factor antagonist